MKESIIYKIIDNDTGEFTGAYSRACHTEYEFSSIGEARRSNVNGVFQDKRKYRIQKWKVTYELIEDDVDPYVQTTIPYYKDYFADKVMKETLVAIRRKAWNDFLNQVTKSS